METFTATSAAAAAASDACHDDPCSICLEDFTAHNPATITTCKHEYHLQCILEWCQRSRECPICWRTLVLSDPLSQELVAAVEIEKCLRIRRRLNCETPVFTTTSGDSLYRNILDMVRSSSDESDNDERTIQEHPTSSLVSQAHHVSSLVSQAHHVGGRLRRRLGPLNQSQRPYLGISSDASAVQNASFAENRSVGYSITPEGESTAHTIGDELSMQSPSLTHSSIESVATNSREIHLDDRTLIETTSPSSPQSFSSFSNSFKSRLSEASSRCKATISRNTQCFKEKFLARNNSVKELGKEVKREVTSGFVGVTRIMERLDTTIKKMGNASPDADSSEGSDMTRNSKNLRRIHVTVPPDECTGGNDSNNH